MTESRESASASSSNPFPDSGFTADSGFSDRGPSPDAPVAANDLKQQASLALTVARAWVRDHQKASMLGAFALGVFTGAWLRE
ncbi:MAG: hypothetical protein ACLFTE_08030 [Salinivenus sp.]